MTGAPPPAADTSPPAVVVTAPREGHVVLKCKVAQDGALRDCAVLKEEPAGLGLGSGSLRMARTFHIAPAQRGGVVAEGSVTFPITWRLATGDERRVDIAPTPPEAKPLSGGPTARRRGQHTGRGAKVSAFRERAHTGACP